MNIEGNNHKFSEATDHYGFKSQEETEPLR